jgi:hypothetical protein
MTLDDKIKMCSRAFEDVPGLGTLCAEESCNKAADGYTLFLFLCRESGMSIAFESEEVSASKAARTSAQNVR